MSGFFSGFFICGKYDDANVAFNITGFQNGCNIFTQDIKRNTFVFCHGFKYVSSYMYILVPFTMQMSFIACIQWNGAQQK